MLKRNLFYPSFVAAAFLVALLGVTPAFAVEDAALAPVDSTATTASGVKTVPAGFTDVPRSHPNYVPITFFNQVGVLGGYADGTFKPDNAINRAEVLKVLFKGSGIVVDEATGTTEEADDAGFKDVPKDAWFKAFVRQAKKLGIVSGNPDGTFTPGRQVTKAEFLKMVLLANQVNTEALKGKESPYPDVPKDAWFAQYINYGAALGLVTKNADGKLEPGKALTRGDVAEIMYLLVLIQKGKDTQFLLNRAEAELAQVEVYIAANRVPNSKKASELAVDLTQQALKNMSDNNVVLGAAKLARAYDLLVDSFVLGIQKKNAESAAIANQAITKATEAWEANNATQPIAKHIKDRAREILTQVGGTEEK